MAATTGSCSPPGVNRKVSGVIQSSDAGDSITLKPLSSRNSMSRSLNPGSCMYICSIGCFDSGDGNAGQSLLDRALRMVLTKQFDPAFEGYQLGQ